MIQAHLVARLLLALTTVLAAVPSYAQAPITYRVSFADAEHHRMHVAVTFPELPDGTLEVMMLRTSPCRYAMHEFAKNVYDVEIGDGSGASLPYDQPSPSQWNVGRVIRLECQSAVVETSRSSRWSLARTQVFKS